MHIHDRTIDKINGCIWGLLDWNFDGWVMIAYLGNLYQQQRYDHKEVEGAGRQRLVRLEREVPQNMNRDLPDTSTSDLDTQCNYLKIQIYLCLSSQNNSTYHFITQLKYFRFIQLIIIRQCNLGARWITNFKKFNFQQKEIPGRLDC